MRLVILAFLSSLTIVNAKDWERRDFDLNGIPVTAVHVKGAKLFSALSVFNVGLVGDEPEQEQFAHLVEHLILRSTDPVEKATAGFRVNGETSARNVRLETFCSPDRWKEALGRHVTWRKAPKVDAKLLEAEKLRILQEVDFTVPRGFAHKWADVAWNQVVRHGRSNVSIRGPVKRIDAASASEAVERYLATAQVQRMILVGPQTVDEIEKGARKVFGKVNQNTTSRKADRKIAARMVRRRHFKATWDLNATHYMEWCPLPNETDRDRAAGVLLALYVQQVLQGSAELKAIGARAFASADMVTPEGRWLTVSVSLRNPEDLVPVRLALREVFARLKPLDNGKDAFFSFLTYVTFLMSPPMNFRAARRAQQGRPGAEYVEARVVFQRIARELGTGLSAPECTRALWHFLGYPQKLKPWVEKLLEAKRSTLLLKKRTEA
ncbi:MAG: hypothetical protein AAF517_00995 [Planctomycetota bacterium]